MNAPHNNKTNESTKIIFSEVANLISFHFLILIIFLPSEYQRVNLYDTATAKRYAESSKNPAWWKISKIPISLK